LIVIIHYVIIDKVILTTKIICKVDSRLIAIFAVVNYVHKILSLSSAL